MGERRARDGAARALHEAASAAPPPPRGAAKTTGAAASLVSIPGYLDGEGPPPADRLDRLLQGVRLGIISALAVNEALSFGELKRLLQVTDGNLSVHARRLQQAGYVATTKEGRGRSARTLYRLSPQGRVALERYLDHMEAIIRATRGGDTP